MKNFVLGFFACALFTGGIFGFTQTDQFRARNSVAANNAAVVSLRSQITSLQCSQVVSALGGTCTTVPNGAVTTIEWLDPNVKIETAFPYSATCTVP